MWLVDTSVWIDYFNGTVTPQADRLDIATFAIANDLWLLHSDRDFDPFEAHLALKVVH